MNTYSIKDLLVQSFSNIDFPSQYVAAMNTPGLENVGITSFYEAFCQKNGFEIKEGESTILTPATILGYLFTSFLIPQQEFFSSISNKKIDDKEWGVEIEKSNRRELNHLAKRLRNSLAHNRIIMNKNGSYIFWDAAPSVKEFENAEIVFKFDFEGLMIKFIPKWHEELLGALS